MNLDGARVYFEGVNVNHEYDDKIREIVSTIKSISPSSEVSMRFLKNGNLYEGLLWGKASEVPIGVYNRGQSMTHVLDTLCKKVRKQSHRVLKTKRVERPRKKRQSQSREPMAMAG